jgi:hypothetical protein
MTLSSTPPITTNPTDKNGLNGLNGLTTRLP